MTMEHRTTYTTLAPLLVRVTCTCKLRGESATREGAVRVMRRKHREQSRKARARARG